MTMWTLLLLCSVIISHGVQGQYWPDYYTTDPAHQMTEQTIDPTPGPSDTPCGGYLYGTRGQFYSPGYPDKYPNNADCVWYIRPGRRIIELRFPFVNVEGDFNCRYDAISVYDGHSVHARLMGKLCGGQSSTFYSTGDYITVRFRSDGSSNYRGFQAEYRIAAGGSCRYNCGYQVGNCSCTDYCGYSGDCCPDYEMSGCGATTTEPTTEPATEPTTERTTELTTGPTTEATTGPATGPTEPMTESTTEPATASGSCRHYCGYNTASCSCRSNCWYYGNCCHDYRDYCESTTPAVTDQPSCRYSCGYNLGSCSCSSSCRYYGNCCHDYNTYCQSTTAIPTSVPACGGSLHGSGYFSSPYYPNYYHDNAYCVWYLTAPYDQRIFLSITDLQMENCCGCDYINIYDGPYVGSSVLGKVCDDNNGTQTTFVSSSNRMTVLFRSDSSVVGRGFNAEFTSTLSPTAGSVDCSSDNMNIVIDRSYLTSLGINAYNVYLNDQYCRPQVSSNKVVFSFPINTCGTVRTFDNGRVVYTNAVRAYASSYGEVTRQSHFKLNVSCRMEQDTMVQILYRVHEIDNSTIAGTGRFNGTMAFYTSSSFYYRVTENPYEVVLNQNMYVQVNLRRDDSSLVLFLDTCVASPSPHDFHSRYYDLVRNGCPRDNSYYAYVSGSRSYARFTFKAFQFLRAHRSVYVQCKILICQASDYNSRCRRGCQTRKARDLGSAHESHTLVLGPIQLKDLEKQDEGKEEVVKAEVEA